jgi:hypothetical protein
MGLNWILQDKIKEGYLPEYKELVVKLNLVKNDVEILKIKTRLKELVIIPQEVAECKRVGIDLEATEYLKKELKKSSPELSKPEYSKDLDKIILKNHGKYVDSLVPSYKANAIADYYSLEKGCLNFKGSLIGNNCNIPYLIKDEAYQDHNATQVLKYVMNLQDFIIDNNELDYHNLEIVKSAIKWLKFWGSNGFGFIVSNS